MLKRFLGGILVATLCVLAAAGQASATTTTVTFTPNPANMYDLDHYYYYSWGIAYQPGSGLTITGATLSIKNINNTVSGTNVLYINLLDNPQTGVHYWSDGDNGTDNWAGQGPLVGTYVDNDINHSQNISFDLGAAGLLSTLNADAANNGVFGFGFDPECHYDNDGVTLTLTVGTPQAGEGPSVPEPVTMASILMGLGALGTYARRRIFTR
jgi:hypothetical protein